MDVGDEEEKIYVMLKEGDVKRLEVFEIVYVIEIVIGIERKEKGGIGDFEEKIIEGIGIGGKKDEIEGMMEYRII